MQRTSFALAVLIGIGFGASHVAEARRRTPPIDPVIDVAGTYTSNWGQVTLRQNGNKVTGSYSYQPGQQGTLAGALDGNMVRYTWHEGQTTGHGVFVVASDHELIGTVVASLKMKPCQTSGPCRLVSSPEIVAEKMQLELEHVRVSGIVAIGAACVVSYTCSTVPAAVTGVVRSLKSAIVVGAPFVTVAGAATAVTLKPVARS
jgi:hypothetical protein